MGGNNKGLRIPNAEESAFGQRGFGRHLLDPAQQGGLMALHDPQSMYGSLFGDKAEKGVFGDFQNTDPGGYMTQEDPNEVRKQKRLADQQGRTQGAMAGQMAYASGLSGGGVQTTMQSQAYNKVLEQYAALRQAMEMQRQQKQQQGLGMLFSMFGMGMGGGMSASSPGTGMGGSAAEYGE